LGDGISHTAPVLRIASGRQPGLNGDDIEDDLHRRRHGREPVSVVLDVLIQGMKLL
jgi:hypothetical protein